MKPLSVVSFAAALLAVSTAHAGWQQTRWGMNMQQAKKIVGPTAKAGTGCITSLTLPPGGQEPLA